VPALLCNVDPQDSQGKSVNAQIKPRVRYADVFQPLDFERLKIGARLKLEDSEVVFEGEHFGQVWIRYKRKIHFLPKGHPAIPRLRLA
jgi:hypothetical protein